LAFCGYFRKLKWRYRVYVQPFSRANYVFAFALKVEKVKKITNEEDHKGDAKVEGIFQFYEFIFEDNIIKTWNFYGIGAGAIVAPAKWNGRGNTAELNILSAIHETTTEKNLEEHNLWAFLGNRRRTNLEENNDESAAITENNDQQLPGFISNSAGTVYMWCRMVRPAVWRDPAATHYGSHNPARAQYIYLRPILILRIPFAKRPKFISD
jgi:hypothetical protein